MNLLSYELQGRHSSSIGEIVNSFLIWALLIFNKIFTFIIKSSQCTVTPMKLFRRLVQQSAVVQAYLAFEKAFISFFFALEEKGIYFVGEKSPTPDLNSVS